MIQHSLAHHPLHPPHTRPAPLLLRSKLANLARAGAASSAEALVVEMGREKMAAGPRVYHALVLAHLNAGSVEGALDAIRREVKAGAWRGVAWRGW